MPDQRVVINKAMNALEKLDVLSKTVDALSNEVSQMKEVLQNIIPAINKSFGNTNQQVSELIEVVDAVVTTLGREVIEQAMVSARKAKAETEAASQKLELDTAVASGKLVSVDKVTDKSVIVGKETNPDGNVRHPGRVQVQYARVEAEFQGKILGQPVGFVLELPTGGKFEIVEIYEETVKVESAPASAAIVEAAQ
jgi:hypothetical protein